MAGSHRGLATPSRSTNGSFASRVARTAERDARRGARSAGSPIPSAHRPGVPSHSVPSSRARAHGRGSLGARGRPGTTVEAEDREEEVEIHHPASALPPTDAKSSAVFVALAALPALRQPETRLAQKAINNERMGNREAILAQACGNVVPSACSLCSKRNGPWTECVVATGFLGGSCANCHYNSGGSKCSLRPPGNLNPLAKYILYIQS